MFCLALFLGLIAFFYSDLTLSKAVQSFCKTVKNFIRKITYIRFLNSFPFFLLPLKLNVESFV